MAGEIYLHRGTTVIWGETITGGVTEQLDLGDGVIGLASAVGVGSYADFGAAPQPDEYELILDIDGFASNPASLGRAVSVYITESADATLWTGPEVPTDTVDSTGSVDRLPNLKFVGAALTRSLVAADNLTVQAIFRSSARYIAPVVHNGTTVNLLATSDSHRIRITPLYYKALT